MKNKKNIKLFWYGAFANIKIIVGGIIMMCSFYNFLITKFVLGVILLIVSMVLIIWGKSQRFDYKQQSGTMIHKGDW
jgi:hypothetical protein